MLFRGIKRLAISLALLGMLSLSAEAAAKKTPKSQAPKKEDMSAYFSENRQGIPPERLREADNLRVQTIVSIQKLMNEPNMNESRKFELYLRLGEIYAERSEYLRDIEMKEYESSFDKWKATGKKGTEPQLSTKNSKAELMKSTEAFRRLVREFPKHPRTDAALYALAKTLLLLDNDNAVLYFNQIVAQHKTSPLLPDTYLALGEFYFYKHDMEKAKDNYKEAMNFKESKVYPYSVYKLGWAYYNSKATNDKDTNENVNKSIAAFKLAIKISERDKENPGNFNLRQEAINDLIMVFAETERIDEAMDYFSHLGEKDAFYDMLEKLGNIYDENGEVAKAIDVFGRLLLESPNRPRNPEIHSKLAKLYDTALQVPAVVDTLKKMRTLYVDPSSKWVVANAAKPELLAESSEKTQKNIHRYATMYHQLGQKTKKKANLEAAAELYRLYLATFPKADEAYELRFYLADIYFNFEQFENAADEYYKVTQERPKDGKYLKQAALASVVSIRKIDEATTYQKLPPPGQVSQPIALPRVKTKLVTMIDNYAKLLPTEKDGFPMRFTAAMTYFEYGHYQNALTRFDQIATELPETAQGQSSVKAVLAYHAERKDWETLVKVGRKYNENAKIMATPVKIEVVKAMKVGTFQFAVQQNKDGKFLEAAKTFESFQQQFPKDELADKALYNASLNYYKVAKVDEALADGNKLLRDYPKSELAKDVTLDMAQTNESLADFSNAARLYKEFGVNYPKEAKAKNALFNAATLYKGLNNTVEALLLYKKFISQYPKDELAKTARLEIAQIAEKDKNYGEALSSYTQYAALWPDRSEGNLVARSRMARVLLVQGNQKEALKEIHKLHKDLTAKNAPAAVEARRVAAGALFNDLEPAFRSFQGYKISEAAKIEKEAGIKQEKLVDLVKRYQQIIDLGSGEFTVASLFRMGEMHENFSKMLFDAPVPTGQSQAQVDAYRSSIEKVAFPLREEGNKFFEAAFQRSQEVQTFTEWTRKTYEKMVELHADKFPVIVEKSTSPTYMSHLMVWDKSVSDLAN
ncbi:MAG: tetratricopeptide repeat protein [Chitinophagaceae bacterium]|nr:tetratricopeptide repeat protein [Oligoflexus sp.]